MERIQTLSPQVANLIAAGEVVERPASIVKELLENSIDAGATRVTVEVESGGVKLLRVIDNGCGMSPRDAVACFGRHATSKVREAADLASVCTLGFRGEALASVAAVSKVTLRTREPDSDEGFEVVIEGGKLLSTSPCGCPVGTEITVRDLFFNTPARKKFLKKDSTETAVISGLLEKLALSRPALALSYQKDGRDSLRTSGTGDLPKAVSAVFGEALAREMLPVSLLQSGIHVHGLCGTPEVARPGRQQQIFFVAGRYVRSRVLQISLEEAYHGSLPGGRYPICVLFVDVHPSRVDANVHPQKMEVKFADERAVYDCVLAAVSQALGQPRHPPAVRLPGAPKEGPRLSSPAPVQPSLSGIGEKPAQSPSLTAGPGLAQSLTLATSLRRRGSVDIEASDWQYYGDKAKALRQSAAKEPAPEKPVLRSATDNQGHPLEGEGQTPLSAIAHEKAALPLDQIPPLEHSSPDASFESGFASGAADRSAGLEAHTVTDLPDAPHPEAPPDNWTAAQAGFDPAVAPSPDQVNPLQQELDVQSFRFVGELFRTYLVAEFEQELWLVDKHAARERILYEQFKAQNRVEQQLLLTPTVLEPGRAMVPLLDDFGATLSDAGFLVEPFGESAILLRAVPMGVALERCADLLLELLHLLEQGRRGAGAQIFDQMLHRIACAAAVKGGDKEPSFAGESLVRELLRLPNVRYCPHGRPCVKVVPRRYLEKEFLRG